MPATPTFRTTTRHMLKESKTYASQTLMGGLSGFESPIGLDRRDRLSALKSGDIGFVRLPVALPVLPEPGHLEDARRQARLP